MVGGDVEIVGETDDDQYDVTLPVKKADFADFLGKIIGGKDKLEYGFRGYISVDSDLLLGVEAALSERVVSQRGGHLVSTRYSVTFSDGRAFKTDKLEKILDISPLSKAYTTALTAEYVFLINYPQSNSPARERVSLSFHDERGYAPLRGHASCELEYYNRTWAEDTLGAMKAIIDTSHEASDDMTYLRGSGIVHRKETGVLFLFLSAFLYCFLVYYFAERFEGFGVFQASTETLTLEEKVDNLLGTYQPYAVIMRGALFLLMGAFIVVMPFLIIEKIHIYTNVNDEDRLLFNLYESDRKEHARNANYKKRARLRAVGAVVVSIASSVVAAFIYGYLVSA